jgi:hypothetical protein
MKTVTWYSAGTVMVLALACALPSWAFNPKTEKVLPSGQPLSERQAQNVLPMAHGGIWQTLLGSKISYSEKEPHITAKLTPAIKALNGTTITASGFILPMDQAENTRHFLLSKRTPTCPFCPPGEPNEVIEVFAAKPVKVSDAMVTMKGKFKLTNNTENGIFFQLENAQ